jgi:hypothetical protein
MATGISGAIALWFGFDFVDGDVYSQAGVEASQKEKLTG